MERFTYIESVKEAIKDYVRENCIDVSASDFDEHQLYDDLWISDSVTGNASGSYTFDRKQAREFVCADIETVIEALQEFETPAERVYNAFISGEFEYLDVAARCYVLFVALSEAIKELKTH